MKVKQDHLGDVSLPRYGNLENDWQRLRQMTFRSNVKRKIAKFLIKGLHRKPTNVAKFLNISRATVYRYINS